MFRFWAVVFYLFLYVSNITANQKMVNLDSLANENEILKQKIEKLESDVESLSSNIEKIQISKDYFTSVLNTQTIIFSTIIVVLIAISWVFSYSNVKSAVNQEFEKQKKATEDWSRNVELMISKKLNSQVEIFRQESNLIYANLNQLYAQSHENNPEVSFLWFLRAAIRFHDADEEVMTRNCLQKLIDSLNNIKEPKGSILFYTDYLNEIHEFFNKFDFIKYKTEIEIIKSNFESLYKIYLQSNTNNA